MMSSDEEGWEDAFVPKRKRKMTKEKAMLGDWGSDDEEPVPFQKFPYRASSSSSSKSGGFMFVSGGVVDLASTNKQPVKNGDENEVTAQEESSKEQSDDSDDDIDSEEDEDDPFRRRARIGRGKIIQRKKAQQEKKQKDQPLGQWEKYSKGVASKLMAKMGWKGQGLGVKEDGMVNPIQAVARMGQTGLDESDYMGISKSIYRKEEAEREEVEARRRSEQLEKEEDLELELRSRWQKSSNQTTMEADSSTNIAAKKQKLVYKTAEQMEIDGRPNFSSKIIDMRPPGFIDMRPPKSYEEDDGESGGIRSMSLDDRLAAQKRKLKKDSGMFGSLKQSMNQILDTKEAMKHSILRKNQFNETILKRTEAELENVLECLKLEAERKSRLSELKQILAELERKYRESQWNMIRSDNTSRNIKSSIVHMDEDGGDGSGKAQVNNPMDVDNKVTITPTVTMIFDRPSDVLEYLSDTSPTLLNGAESNTTLGLNEIAGILSFLKSEFSQEFSSFGMESLVFQYVFPLLENYTSSWNPVQDPEGPLAEFSRWKSLLETKIDLDAEDEFGNQEMDMDSPFGISRNIKDDFRRRSSGLDTFNRMIYEIWAPKVQKYLEEQWNVFDPDLAIAILHSWNRILPTLAYRYMMFTIILKKLLAAINSFSVSKSSSSSSLPLDTWVIPWIPLMGSHSPQILEEVRRKLQQLIGKVSATVGEDMILPFKHFFEVSGNWKQLMARAVVPKIESLFNRLEIDPSNQDMTNFNEAMIWSKHVSVEAFAAALQESSFFSRWFQILGAWLHQPDCDSNQVQQWYSSWKSAFGNKLQGHPILKAQFKLAIQLMLRFVDGDLPPLSSFKPIRVDPASSSQASDASKPGAQQPFKIDATLKEVLEDFAESIGLLLMPTSNKHEGNTVYSLGPYFLYIERDVLFVKSTKRNSAGNFVWEPTSISDLFAQIKKSNSI